MESVENLCRLCLGEITEDKKSIYNSYMDGVQAIEIIEKICYKVNFQRDKRFPSFSCRECFDILESAHQLCEKSVQSERQLQLILSSEILIKEEQMPFEEDDEDYSTKLNICNEVICNDISIANAAVEKIEKEFDMEEDEDVDHDPIDENEDDDDEDPSYNQKPSKRGSSKKFQCQICQKTFEKPSKLARHEKTHDVNRKPYACTEPECFQRFLTPESLQRHQIIHSGMTVKVGPDVKSWPCVICSKEFDLQEAMASHMRTHKDEMEKLEFPCNLCDKVFKKLNDLTRHSRTHPENKNYKCQICSKMFSQGSHLVDHLNRHNNVRPHVCHICNKAFQQSSTLKDHLRTHSKEKPFLCSTCGKSFNNPSNLRQHVKRHLNLKDFECHLCPAKFACKGSLQSHVRSHNGIKNHVCQTCGNSFTKGSSLKKHIKSIHQQIRDHVCSSCPMRFSTSEHLKRHFRTHSGEKPYKCDFEGCSKSYAQTNDLLKHKKIHVGGDNIYKCTYENCNESFRLKSLLRDHYVIHKNGNDGQISQ